MKNNWWQWINPFEKPKPHVCQPCVIDGRCINGEKHTYTTKGILVHECACQCHTAERSARINHEFTLFWADGTSSVVKGPTVEQAMRKSNISNEDNMGLIFWTHGDKRNEYVCTEFPTLIPPKKVWHRR